MNIYLQALGFQDMTSEKEREFLNAQITRYTKDDLLLLNETMNRGVIVVRISASTGLYIYGRFQEDTFIYEYYFPFVIGDTITENDEITIERHLDKESFAVVCDEHKTGVTLIFYLQNVIDYLNYMVSGKEFTKESFQLDRKSAVARLPIRNKKVTLTALSLGGMILLPVYKPESKKKKMRDIDRKRQNMVAAAKRGDQEAIETLTIQDMDTYNQLTTRIHREDVFTIVDSTFMPCGVECDQYSVVGEIRRCEVEKNEYTDELIYIMDLECNDLVFTMAVNRSNLIGEPAVGRRFKGQIWLQGTVKFK